MGKYSWEPAYCVYDVCTCSHAFMEHEKDSTRCYNSSFFDSAKQEVVVVKRCTCDKFRFSRSENFSSYTKKGDNQ